jgi:hypothetical protein
VLRYLLWLDLGLNLLHLAQPYWTRVKLVISLAQAVGAVLCLATVLSVPEVAVLTGGQAVDSNFLNSLGWSVKITAAVFAAVVLWSTLETLRRVWRLRLPRA